MATAPDKEKELQKKLKELQHQLNDQEKTYDQLKKKLVIYESAIGGIYEGIWDYNLKTGEIYASEPCKKMFALETGELIKPEGLADLLHPDDKQRVVHGLKSLIRGEFTIHDIEFRIKHSNENYKWIHCRAGAIRGTDGKAVRISGSFSDITIRNVSAPLTERGPARYGSLFENSPVAMFRMKLDTGEIIDANRRFKNMLENDFIVGTSFYNCFSSLMERNSFKEKLAGSTDVENGEFELTTLSKRNIWVSFSGTRNAEENELDCVLNDVSQTKENLLQLQKMNFELDSFVYHASHDLRSPLRSVLGLIELYRLEDDNEIREQCIDKIEGSIRRLDLLVMDLLSISRNDRIDEPMRAINILNEVNSSISSYYNASNTENLEIITKVHQPVKFLSDLTRVRIIINNLVSNAIKYRSFHKEHSYVAVDVKVNEQEVKIVIEDNGEGIEESKMPHIFDMFFRATEKGEGSGLGLYIVKKVADKLGAKIEVDSVEMEGTTFTVTIPNLAFQEDEK